MSLPRASLLPLLALVLAPGCVINKDLLDGATSEVASTGDDPGGSPQPTTGEPQGGESTGAPGTTTGEGTTGGESTATDATTTGDTGGPMQSELVVFDADGPLCMPVCAADKDPMTPVLDDNCAIFLVDGEGQATATIVRCIQVGDEWHIPAGTVICYQTLIDRGGETPSTIDQMSPVCVDGGFNVEFLVLTDEPLAEGIFLGASCEAASDPEQACPDLQI